MAKTETHHDWSKLTNRWRREDGCIAQSNGIFTVKVYDNGEVDPGGEGLGPEFTFDALAEAISQRKQCEAQEAVPVLTPIEKALAHLTNALPEGFSARLSLSNADVVFIEGPNGFRVDVSHDEVWVSPGIGFSIHDNEAAVDVRYNVMMLALDAYEILKRGQQ